MFVRNASMLESDVAKSDPILGPEHSRNQNRKRDHKRSKTLPELRGGEVKIVWPDSESRSRRVVKRSNSRVTYKYPSKKSAHGGSLHAESELELKFYMLMDANPKVLKIWDQPAEIYFCIDGVTHIHYPDALVETAQNRSFYEIKSETDKELEWAKTREAHLKQALLIQEFNYSLVLSGEIQCEPRFGNVKTLLRHGRGTPTLSECEAIAQIFEKHVDLSWHDFLAGRFSNAKIGVVAAMILSGEITYDDGIQLGPETRLRF